MKPSGSNCISVLFPAGGWNAGGPWVPPDYTELGKVEEVAGVYLNRRSAEILWTPPFRAAIKDPRKPGANDLKIEVINLWINRLIGDESLPADKKFTRTNIRRGQEWEIPPAGLLGSVRVLSSEDVLLRW